MDNVVAYIQRTENEVLKETLKEQLVHVLVLLPEANADLLVQCLSMIDEKEQSRFIAMCRREEVINNKTVMLSIMNMLVSFKTIADTVKALEVSESMLQRSIPGMTEKLLDDFRMGLAETVTAAVEVVDQAIGEIASAQDRLSEAMKLSEQYVKQEHAVLETSYKARIKQSDEAHTHRLLELDKQIEKKVKEVELVMTKRANEEIQASLLPFVKQALGWKGIMGAIFIMTMTQLLHDGIKWLVIH